MGRVVSYNEDIPRCTFCGKTERQVRKLVAGPNASICDECIALCVDIISEERSKDAEVNSLSLPKPTQIFDYLNRYVIGQEEAKRALSVACTTITSASIWSCRNPPNNLTARTAMPRSNQPGEPQVSAG